MKTLGLLVLTLTAAVAAEVPKFFAMDTAARGNPAESAQLLAALGYDGFGGRPATAKIFAAELTPRKVAYVNAYHVTKFSHESTDLPVDLVQAITAVEGLDTTLWLGIQQVQFPDGVKPGPSSGDAVVVPALKKALVLAKAKRVKLSLYPHAGFWADSVEACLRVANAVDDLLDRVVYSGLEPLAAEERRQARQVVRGRLRVFGRALRRVLPPPGTECEFALLP